VPTFRTVSNKTAKMQPGRAMYFIEDGDAQICSFARTFNCVSGSAPVQAVQSDHSHGDWRTVGRDSARVAHAAEVEAHRCQAIPLGSTGQISFQIVNFRRNPGFDCRAE